MNLSKKLTQNTDPMLGIDSRLPVWKVWKLMKKSHRKYLPVIEAGRLVGVVKGTDVAMMTALSPGSMDLTDIIDTVPLCVKLTQAFQELVDQLTSEGREYVVLVDDFNSVLEIVSANQVLKFMNQNPAPEKSAFVNDIYQWRLKHGNY